MIDHPTIDSAEVAQRLGITVQVLRRIRKTTLVEGTDWFRDGNRVVIAENAFEKIRAAMVPQSEEKEAPQTPGGEPTLPQDEPQKEVRCAVVVSCCRVFDGKRRHYANPCVIQARIEETGEKVFVRVKHSQNYAPKCRDGTVMTLTIEKRGTQWAACGRAPRFPGKW